jgi:hypothetical protein
MSETRKGMIRASQLVIGQKSKEISLRESIFGKHSENILEKYSVDNLFK